MAETTGFAYLTSQAAHIEAQVQRVRYPDIQYPRLVPIDTSAPEWIRTITWFSSDHVGAAQWFGGQAADVPLAEVFRDKNNVTVEMAAIGYSYTEEELSEAARVPGMNLSTDRAMAARRAAEEFLDKLVLNGDSTKGWNGLFNDTAITKSNAPAGAGGDEEWSAKTADEILADVNTILSGVWDSSKTVEMADTLLLPPSAYSLLTSKRIPDTSITVMDFVKGANIYTAMTGMELMIRVGRGLENAGASNVGRAMAYRRHPDVLKFHLPMPHKFLPVWRRGPITYTVPGIVRTGGLEIRRPGACRYLDMITT